VRTALPHPHYGGVRLANADARGFAGAPADSSRSWHERSASALHCHDLSGEHCRGLGMGCGVKVDAVPLIEAGRDCFWVINDDTDAARVEPFYYRRDVGGTLLLGSEKRRSLEPG
jgi:hypothetical protein